MEPIEAVFLPETLESNPEHRKNIFYVWFRSTPWREAHSGWSYTESSSSTQNYC